MRPVTLPLLLFACLALRWPAARVERVSTRERFKVVIAPLICKRTCERNGQCRDTCEQGDNTTLIGENGQAADTLTGHGFRVVQFNVRVHHSPDTSVVIQPFDQSEAKLSKGVPRLPSQTQKPRGRCFQETTPKQACNSNPLPGLTNQEDCCGSVGNSWGQTKCYKCPKLPYINECMMQGICQNGECLNTQGSFRCTCKPGYVLKDRTRCVVSVVDQGPCFLMMTEAGRCEHALATNLSRELCCCTVGKAWGFNCERCPQDGTASFSKICPAGKGMSYLHYRSTLAIKTGIGEIPILPHKGETHTRVQTPRQHAREVPVQVTTPTQLQPISTHVPRVPVLIPRPTTRPIIHIPREKETLVVAQTQVSQVDECKLSRNICGHGECINTHNGFTYENECEGEPCGHGRGTCINTVGSYRCNCHPGHQLIGHHVKPRCVDINECSTPDICGIGGHCINLPGSYKCECLPGFRSKSRRQPVCEDINECLDPATCPDAQCENTVGSYECIPCQPGHKVHGGVCYDINECQDTRLCANGHCINTEGSFQCQCYPGYQPTQEGSHCEDINECERASNCHRGRCINTMGSYRCECQKGYMLINGRRCQDIDECEVDRSLCQPYGVCENRQGGYVCVCNDGFILSEDKHSCEGTPV
ncbi:hypothetical protein QTP86_026660 [Hemibagrus guttatus]|nr:hypothetical protein QTP86_026660 [Hemibagrus guttatus]